VLALPHCTRTTIAISPEKLLALPLPQQVKLMPGSVQHQST